MLSGSYQSPNNENNSSSVSLSTKGISVTLPPLYICGAAAVDGGVGSRDAKGASRAGRGEMSRGCDVAEGTLPQWTVLFEMTAGSTLETPVVVEDAGMGRGLSSKGSSSVR